MALTRTDIDQIAERWDKTNWDKHEQAFARQWMTQAQDDIRALVAALRDLHVDAQNLADDVQDAYVDAQNLVAGVDGAHTDAKALADGAKVVIKKVTGGD